MLFSAVVASEEVIPIKIAVNTADKGEYFVMLDDENKDIYIVESDMLLLGIRLAGKRKKFDRLIYVSLRSLDPKLLFRLNLDKLSLDINVMPLYLSKTKLDLENNTSRRKLLANVDSAFINYSIVRRDSSEFGFELFDVPIESVVNIKKWMVKSNFNYHYNNLNQQVIVPTFTRGLSSVTRDFVAKRSRLIIGDFIGQSGELGGSSVLFGVSYRKKYNISNYFAQFPGLSVKGLLQTPSQVNMYVNDVLLRSDQMPAGEFEIANLPNLYGAGKLKLEVVDAFGRRTVSYIPYYISSKLLRVGLDDFGYNLGFKRNSLSEELASYSAKPTLMGFHRWGLRKYFTAGYRFELSDQLSNVGVNSNMLAGAYGEIETGISRSRVKSEDGIATYFRYSFTSQYFYGQYRFNSVGRNYGTLSSQESEFKLSQFQSLSLGIHGFKYGSISLNYSETDYYDKVNVKTTSLVYNLGIVARTTILLRAVRTEDVDGTNNAIIASVNTSFGRKTSTNISHESQNKVRTTSASMQSASPIGTGTGYRVKLRQEEDELNNVDYLADVSLEAKMKYASVIGNVYQGANSDSYLTQVAGSIAYIENDYYFSRPIIDSFGLVKLADLDDVQIYFGNEPIDKTKNGRLLVPNLTSYADNRIAIEATDIPLDRSISETEKLITPKLRGGSVAEFKVEQFQGFSGHLYYVLNNVEKAAEYADLLLIRKGQAQQTMVGRGGEFYFENLASGWHRAELKLPGRSCKFSLYVPKNKATMVELGKHVCRE